MIRLGLTGSIGMGKSTTADMFRAAGDRVIDADAIVHDLYRGRAVVPVEAAFSGVSRDGAIDRAALGQRVLGDGAALARLEAIVHPMVREAEADALAAAAEAGCRIAVLDIPLLFEAGREGAVDAIVVVSAPLDVQRERVLARPGMTPAKFAAILEKQRPDAQKRQRAHFIVDTGDGLEPARRQVEAIRRAAFAMAY